MSQAKNILLIVGNGFDLNIGLETSYNDFLNSVDLPTNTLFHELKDRNKTNWVDIEKELEDCANYNTRSIAMFSNRQLYQQKTEGLKHSDYIELKNELKQHLKKQIIVSNSSVLKTKSAYKLLHSLLIQNNTNLTILNFNYTNTIEKLISMIDSDISLFTKHNLTNVSNKTIYVHGNLKTDIVFGIDDKAEVKQEHVYLHKSFDNNTSCENIKLLLQDNAEIYFFGYSLGKTDESYFDDFFKSLCIDREKSKADQQKITFFYYKESGYIELFYRLINLTSHNTAKLKQYNNIDFIDASKLLII